jgi:branched-chain amino acid transport system substrate-binding protein
MKKSTRHNLYLFTLLLSVVIIISFIVPGCGQPAASKPDAAAVKTPIKIGGSLPLTGPASYLGKFVKAGYDKWAEDINASGGLLGRKVELVIYDDQSDPKNAATLLDKVITVDKVNLLAGGYPGGSAAVQMPIAEQYRMVFISMGGQWDSFQKGFTFSFAAPPLMNKWWYDAIWDWIATIPQDQRPKTAAIYALNYISSMDAHKVAPDVMKKLGIEVAVYELYDFPLASAEPLISKAKAANADMFYQASGFEDGMMAIKAAKAMNYNPKIMVHGAATLVPAWNQMLKEDANYIISGVPINPKLPYPGIAELNKWYTAANPGAKYVPDYILLGYSWMQTLQKGVEGTGSLDNAKIRDYLRNNEISAVGGKFKFDKTGVPQPFSYAAQTINGQLELIYPLNVQSAKPVYPKPEWGSK